MDDKELEFAGGSLDDLLEFPESVRRQVGYQLGRVQNGDEPDDWKSLRGLGKNISGVREIRVREIVGSFRVIYVVTPGESIWVLHAFQKKTQRIDKTHRDVIVRRYKAVEKLTAQRKLNELRR